MPKRMKIADMKIPTMTKNALCNAGLKTVRDLIAKNEMELLCLYSLSWKSLIYITNELETMGLKLSQHPYIPRYDLPWYHNHSAKASLAYSIYKTKKRKRDALL